MTPTKPRPKKKTISLRIAREEFDYLRTLPNRTQAIRAAIRETPGFKKFVKARKRSEI